MTQAACYPKVLNELLHAFLKTTNVQLTVYEPKSNVLGWIPLSDPVMQQGRHPAPFSSTCNGTSRAAWWRGVQDQRGKLQR